MKAAQKFFTAALRELPRCNNGRKIKYASEEGATAAVMVAIKQPGFVVRTYLCSFCGGWHLTSQAFDVRRGRRAR